MDYHIKSIKLDEEFKQFTFQGSDPEWLRNLSKINIFVGANNSGKSRYMRKLANATLKFASLDLIAYLDIRKDFEEKLLAYMTERNFGDVNNYVKQYKEFRDVPFITEETNFPDDFLKFLDRMGREDNVQSRMWNMPGPSDMAYFKKLANETLAALKMIPHVTRTYKFRRLYFPTLRGLRPFHAASDVYAIRTQEDYFSKILKAEIFTGLTLYQEIQGLLLGNLEKRQIINEFQNFLSNRFFEGRPIALIPKLGQDVLDIKIGDEKEFPIYNLGDGIQSIIILTFPLFKYKSEYVLAFIEEPELFMHPGMQRVLLNALSSFPNHQYFLTTHSNHFLDITLDVRNVSVYTFTKELGGSESVEKEAKFTLENVSNENNRSLELLGVRNSSVFLSNCTIWVEGITDRRYLAHYLKLYQGERGEKAYKEDLHYSFVEYGGGNITHFSFLDNEEDSIVVDRLCGRLFLVTDKDTGEGAKAERHKKLKEKLKERYYCLKSKEIENLLSPAVIKDVVKEYEPSGVAFKEFCQQDYKNMGLGVFIETGVLAGERKRRGAYAAESGTITDKVGFCNKAISKIKNFSDLSPEAQSLTKLIYDFIKKHN